MVVPTPLLSTFFTAPLIRERTADILGIIASRHEFIDRARAEVSPEFKQIIPYVIVRHDDDYFVLRRTAKQTESRLHHKVSLGIGGHVNPGHTLMQGLQQELNEEVDVASQYALRFVGILNDDSTDVGRVHLGAVFELVAEEPKVTVRETEKMTGAWMSRDELGSVREQMETWSQIVYDGYIEA